MSTELLGEIVTWDMASMEVPYSRVLDALTTAALSREFAKELRPTTAFTRACKAFRDNRTIDRVRANEGIITFQFTQKHLETSGILEFDYECLVQLDCNDGEITCPESREIEQHARDLFRHAIEHRTTSDITRLVQTMFEKQADLYPINPRKGVAYFVPEKHREFSAAVEIFLTDLGGKLLRFPVPKGTKEGNRSVKAAVEAGLASLLAELESCVNDWNDKTRETTMEKAIERWQQIKHKAEAYSEYLGDRQAKLLADLDTMKRRLAAKIQEKQDDKQRTAA